MGNWLTLMLILLVSALHSQSNPRFFPKQVNPDSSNFEQYSQKNGQNYRANLWDLKRYYTPKYPGVVAYVPAPTGNALNRTEFVKGADGVIYYIDATGKSVKFEGGVTPGALSDSLAYVLELVSDWDTSATNELQVIYIVNHRLYISGTVTPGLSLAPYRDSIFIVHGGGRDTLKTSTGYKALLPIADGSETKLNVSGLLAVSGNGTTGTPYSISTPGGDLSGTGGAGFVGLPTQSTAPSTPASGVRIYADGSGRFSFRSQSDGYSRIFNGALTGDRVYGLQNSSGMLAMLEVAQSFTGVQTFAPSGSGGAGFIYNSTARPAHPFGAVTTAQRDAQTGMSPGDGVYNATLKRINIWDGSWLAVPTMASGGIGNNYLVFGDSGGNLISDANFVVGYNALTPQLYLRGRNIAEVDVNGQVTYGTGANVNNVRFIKDARFEGSLDNAIGNLLIRGNPGINLAGLSQGGYMSLTSSGIDVNYNTPPSLNLTGLGSLFRLGGTGTQHTYNNATTAASGTVNFVVTGAGFRGGIISSTNTGVTYTNATSVFVESSPIAGTNSTITNSWALVVNRAWVQNRLYASPSSSVFSINAQGFANSYYASAPIYAHSGQLSSSNASIVAQSLSNATGITTIGIIGAAVSGSATVTGILYGVIGEAAPQQTMTSGGATGVYGSVRTADQTGTGSVTAVGANVNMQGSVVGGAQNGAVYGFYGGVSQRQNAGSALVQGIRWAGIPATSGGANLGITTYNPIAVNFGSTDQVANLWSFIDHRITIGAVTQTNASAVLELISTVAGFLISRGTDAQIAAVPSPALALQMFSTTSERINVKRTAGFYQVAYTQDIKRDSSYKVVNANLDLSAETAHFKTRNYLVRIFTAVTAAAAGNNLVTMPVPSSDLLGVQFKFYITDVSGDADISQIQFGTDGTDGYLSNGDGTYQSTFNLHAGFDVDVSIGWDENKLAYRWFLR